MKNTLDVRNKFIWGVLIMALAAWGAVITYYADKNVSNEKTYCIVFINNGYESKSLGMVKYELNAAGKEIGYKEMNEGWNEETKVFYLTRGRYAITQWETGTDKITSFLTIDVPSRAYKRTCQKFEFD